MPKFVRLLKSSEEKDSLEGEESQMKCKKCGIRPSMDPDGLCNQCKFDDVLTQLVNQK